MNFLDAISSIAVRDGSKWARPVGVTGEAYVIEDAYLEIVPTHRGGERVAMRVADILRPWEIVDPEQVLMEAYPCKTKAELDQLR